MYVSNTFQDFESCYFLFYNNYFIQMGENVLSELGQSESKY